MKKAVKLIMLQRKLKNLSFEQQVKLLSELAKQKHAEDYGKSPDGRYHLFIVSDTLAIFVDYHDKVFRVIDKRKSPQAFQKVLDAIKC